MNPDPLEVWDAALKAFFDAVWNASALIPEQAAAAIIAQHYEPLLAEVERLRGEVAMLAKRCQGLERGPLYQRPKWDCGHCSTPTTCAMYGRCMPIIGEPSSKI